MAFFTSGRLLLATGILGMACSVTPAAAQRGETLTLRTSEVKADAMNPVIDMTVEASVSSAPDAASFSTGVETRAATARDAIDKNAEKMTAVINQLKAAGIAAKDIQTSAISLGREYIYPANGRRKVKGYLVSNTVTATLRDMSRLGDMIDALVASGATEFSGPNFEISDTTEIEAKARDEAWARAYTAARYHAKKAGFADVRVLRVAETVRQDVQGQEVYAMAEAAAEAADAAASTPLEGGEIATSVNLAISFQMTN